MDKKLVIIPGRRKVESVQEFRAVVRRLSETFDCESHMWEKCFTAGCG